MEHAVRIEAIIAQVRSLMHESRDRTEFDCERWVRASLERPLPALGGRRPAEFMDTEEGRSLISDLLAQQQSGAYA